MNLKPSIIALGLIAGDTSLTLKDFYTDKVNKISRTETVVTTEVKGKTGNNDYENKFRGKISVFGNYAITTNHVVSQDEVVLGVISGQTMTAKIENKVEVSKIDGQELAVVEKNVEKDYAVFDLKKTPELCERYCNTLDIKKSLRKKDIYQGMDIYFLASPAMQVGFYIESKIAKTNVKISKDEKEYNIDFLTDTFIVNGTSGTIVYHREKPLGMINYKWVGYGGGKTLDGIIDAIEKYEDKNGIHKKDG